MIVLLLGGARSGKSALAERMAGGLGPPVTYVATAPVTIAPGAAGADADMAARIAAHRARRPASWATVEAPPDLVGELRGITGTVIVDALGTWVAAAPGLSVEAGALCAALAARAGDTIVVSDEVGFGVHPPTAVGRRFVDALGDLNQAVAAVADEVMLVVAGRVMRLETAI